MSEQLSKVRPIIFSAPMVRALLAGRKVQTRRILKPQPPTINSVKARAGIGFGIFDDTGGRHPFRVSGPVWAVRELMDLSPEQSPGWRCPYGSAGDLLWVRETYGEFRHRPGIAVYRADDENVLGASNPWRPSIHMPRWASRITLRITDVRVERLQDISEADANAEGVDQDEDRPEEPHWKLCPRCGGTGLFMDIDPQTGGATFDKDCMDCDTAVKRYRWLWESINGDGSWESNPWVWVVSFERVSDAKAAA